MHVIENGDHDKQSEGEAPEHDVLDYSVAHLLFPFPHPNG